MEQRQTAKEERQVVKKLRKIEEIAKDIFKVDETEGLYFAYEGDVLRFAYLDNITKMVYDAFIYQNSNYEEDENVFSCMLIPRKKFTERNQEMCQKLCIRLAMGTLLGPYEIVYEKGLASDTESYSVGIKRDFFFDDNMEKVLISTLKRNTEQSAKLIEYFSKFGDFTNDTPKVPYDICPSPF